jgi:hypothetical protein
MRRALFLVIVSAQSLTFLFCDLEPSAEARPIDELFLDSGAPPRKDAGASIPDQWMPPRLDAIAEVHPTPLAP